MDSSYNVNDDTEDNNNNNTSKDSGNNSAPCNVRLTRSIGQDVRDDATIESNPVQNTIVASACASPDYNNESVYSAPILRDYNSLLIELLIKLLPLINGNISA